MNPSLYKRLFKRQQVKIELGQVRDDNSWATYYTTGTIEIHAPMKEDDPMTQYCKTIIGVDHEYLHHILFKVEGRKACEAFDRLAGNLVGHCQWIGLKLTIEARTDGFWNRVDS